MIPDEDPDAVLEGENRAAMWTYIWVMVGFKLVTIAMILWFTHAFAAVAILIALHIPWIAAAVFLMGIPSAFWYRLIKVRARRSELIWQEYNVSPPPQGLEVPV